MTNINSSIINQKINKYENYIDTLQNILNILDTYPIDTKKFYKHNPFSIDPKYIKSVQNINNEIHVKYSGFSKHDSTIIFNYSEKGQRSFTLSNNIKEHTDLIKIQLTCQINKIQCMYINPLKEILNNYNKYSSDEINLLIHQKEYDIKDIYSKKVKDKVVDYYISICPIYGFYLESGRIYIANQYNLKIQNNMLYLFVSNEKSFNVLLARPFLNELIKKFNKSYKKITSNNFMNIINNMRGITPDFTLIDNNNNKYKVSLKNMDDIERTIEIINVT